MRLPGEVLIQSPESNDFDNTRVVSANEESGYDLTGDYGHSENDSPIAIPENLHLKEENNSPSSSVITTLTNRSKNKIESIDDQTRIELPENTEYLFLQKGRNPIAVISDVSQIDQGRNGRIYSAKINGDHAAIKVSHPKCVDGLKNEVRVYAELAQLSGQHSNFVIELYAAFVLDSQLRAAFHYYENGNLSSFLNLNKHNFNLNDRVKFSLQTANCVAFIHSVGLIHADLKVENFLVDNQGDLRLSDMGCAFFASDSNRNFGGEVWYRSPQMLRSTKQFLATKSTAGLQQIGFSDDVYSAALVFHHILTGKLPFSQYSAFNKNKSFFDAVVHQSERPELAQISDTSELLAQLITSMWDNDEAKRPTMRDVVERLSSK